MKNLLLFIILLITTSINAQVAPDFFVEDAVDAETLRGLDCDWCQPGLANKSRSRGLDIAYQSTGRSSLLATNADGTTERIFPELNQLNLLVLKLKIPIIVKEDFKFLLGTSYRPEYYNLAEIGTVYAPEFAQLDGETMKSSAIQALATKALDEYSYLSFRFKAKYNGDYSGFINFDKRYAIYSFTALYGVKKTELVEWGVGITFNSSFRNRFIALPVFQYNRNFNQKWGIELFLPAIAKLRYNHSPKTIFMAGVNFSSRNYRLGVTQQLPEQEVLADYVVRHSEIQMGVEVEQKIIPWLWASARVGYQTNFRTSFEDKNEFATPFEVEPTNMPFLRVGIFISPPDNMIK